MYWIIVLLIWCLYQIPLCVALNDKCLSTNICLKKSGGGGGDYICCFWCYFLYFEISGFFFLNSLTKLLFSVPPPPHLFFFLCYYFSFCYIYYHWSIVSLRWTLLFLLLSWSGLGMGHATVPKINFSDFMLWFMFLFLDVTHLVI